jgi:hypothetical protein
VGATSAASEASSRRRCAGEARKLLDGGDEGAQAGCSDGRWVALSPCMAHAGAPYARNAAPLHADPLLSPPLDIVCHCSHPPALFIPVAVGPRVIVSR